MSRAKWKGPYFKKEKKIKKSFTVTPQFTGLTVKVYTGRKSTELNITEEMVGCKIGEFISTREKFEFKKKKKK